MDHPGRRLERRVESELAIGQPEHREEGRLPVQIAPDRVDDVALLEVNLPRPLAGADAEGPALSAVEEDLHHVGDGGAARGGDDADAVGVARQRALTGGFEKAFFGQFLFELFEGELQGAVAEGFQEFDDVSLLAA